MAPKMIPIKGMLGQNKQSNNGAIKKGMTTRSQCSGLNSIYKFNDFKESHIKRKADISPLKEKTNKRHAFTNITNAISTSQAEQNRILKKGAVSFKSSVQNIVTQKPATNIVQKSMTNITQSLVNVGQKSVREMIDMIEKTTVNNTVEKNTNIAEKPVAVTKIAPVKSKSSLRVTFNVAKDEGIEASNKIVNIRHSIDQEESEDSLLYVSALEDVTDSTRKTRRSKVCENEKKIEKDEKSKPASPIKEISANSKLLNTGYKSLSENLEWDFDAENLQDPLQVSCYAMDIFTYLRERESKFPIDDYMDRQTCLSQWMRALLVDWMVEVQESFELNHETLYLAVKLVDLYLSNVMVSKETLQLLGAASLFISSKYDERIPPMVEDFLYICDGAYTQKELLKMEVNVLKVINFDVGIPISYRFLRRYARCAKVSMPTLTLARYILEYSLMDYSMIMFSDSKIAAAALLLALLMKDLGGWTPILEYYSGYKVTDIEYICKRLNEGLHRKHKETLMTIRNKYSHKIFFEVAKLPLKETLNI